MVEGAAFSALVYAIGVSHLNLPELLDIEERIRSVVGEGEEPLHAPLTTRETSVNVLRALEESRISVDVELESQVATTLARLGGVEGVVLTSSGTSALHLALLTLGVKAGDKVVCPAVSFVATANAILYCGAEPCFVDVEEESLGISPSSLRECLQKSRQSVSGPFTRENKLPVAIVLVSVFGLVPRITEVAEIAAEFDVPLIIDAAGALGSTIGSKSILSFGSIAIASFNGNKIISCGGGGAIFSSNEEVITKANSLSKVAKVPHPFEFIHSELGFNFRMPAINAALLLDQLGQLQKILLSKRLLHDAYEKAFEASRINVFRELSGTSSNYWLNSISLVKSDLSASTVCSFLNKKGLGARPLWTVLPKLAHLAHFSQSNNFKVAERVTLNTVSLPSSYTLDKRWLIS